jgi:hypothetical protein
MIKKANQDNGEQKIREALEIIVAMGLPRQQQNERSALTLLSLLNIKPADRWQDAGDPLIGITPHDGIFRKPLRQALCAEHAGNGASPDGPSIHAGGADRAQSGQTFPADEQPQGGLSDRIIGAEIAPGVWKTRLEGKAPGISEHGRVPEQALRPGTGHGANPRDFGQWPCAQAFARGTQCPGQEDH